MFVRKSLKRRITFGLFGYLVLLGTGIVGFGWVVQETAEAHIWESILLAELERHIQQSAAEPGYRWRDTESLTLHESGLGDSDTPFADLAPGVHDEVSLGKAMFVVLIEQRKGKRFTLMLNISDLEREEESLVIALLASGLLTAALLFAIVVWGVGRLIYPLQLLATQIGRLTPGNAGARVTMREDGSIEEATITDAVNDFLDRNDMFVERERAFIDTASHELRTPITVIAGAAELALSEGSLPPLARGQLARIQRTAQGVERLLPLLLVLAKAPERLAQLSDRVALNELVLEIIDDHQHLLGDKALEIRATSLPTCVVSAPLNIVQTAIGNLLRNAIENSDSGIINITLSTTGAVCIEDPGHRMSPEQISMLYSRLARGKGRDGGGIGLDLIARLCAHLRWQLSFDPLPAGGTRVTLDLSASLLE